MRIWRKDSTRPIKADTPAKNEEFTDISLSSTPKENTKNTKKDKMEEIYSTKDKQVKYKRQTPLEAEEAAKRAKSAKEQLASGKAEISLDAPDVPEKIVKLTSEYEEGTVIADDIIESVDSLSNQRSVHLQDIDGIDIDIDPFTALKKYERQASETKRHDERNKQKQPKEPDFSAFRHKNPKAPVVVAKIPVYQHESKINRINLKAGRFSEVVEREYDEYLKSNDPTISKKINSIGGIEAKQSLLYTLSQLANNHKNEAKQTSQKPIVKHKQEISEETVETKKKPKGNVRKFFRVCSSVIASEKEGKNASFETVDYQDRQDAKYVAKEINNNLKKLTLKSLIFAGLFIFTLMLSIIAETDNATTTGFVVAPFTYCMLNLLSIIAIGVVAKSFIFTGLRPLKGFAGNSDTALAFAYVACFVQQFASLFYPTAFVDSSMHLYTCIIALAFMLGTIGRIVMVLRVKKNFKFITSKNPPYAGKIFSDEDTARKMLSGTTASRSVIAYQHPTDFLSDFLKISYAPDPSEESVGKIAPITIISSLFVGIIYGITFHSFIGGISALAVMSCISIPLSILLAGNIPMFLYCRDTLKHGAMVSGYPSVRQFCDSNAIIVKARQLYPKSSIKVDSMTHYADFRIEDSLMYAAAILKEAKNPLAHIFDKTVAQHHSLPKVESVLYEEKLGLVGWVNGERVLIGNKKLLDRYHIYLGNCDDETPYIKQGKCVTYIACSGQLVSMIVTTYTADKTIKEELKRAQSAGLCMLVSTTDCNVTSEKIASDYGLFSRCVKVLGTGYSNVCTEVTSKREETSRAYLATRGKIASLIHAVSGSVSLKNNLTMGNVIQIFGLLLGVLLCATMVLYADVSILNIFEMLLYMLFWGAATIASELIKRH